MSFKLVLKGFKLKKLVVEPKTAQPVESVKELVDRLCSFGRGPVKGCQKLSLSPSGLLFPVEVILFLVEVRSRTGRGPVKAQRLPAKHLILTASQPVDP